jgi:hypothetical protein
MKTKRSIRDPGHIALAILKRALSVKPDACLVGDVMACELAMLAAWHVPQCPKCGAEAWCNIDCDLCALCSELTGGENG